MTSPSLEKRLSGEDRLDRNHHGAAAIESATILLFNKIWTSNPQ